MWFSTYATLIRMLKHTLFILSGEEKSVWTESNSSNTQRAVATLVIINMRLREKYIYVSSSPPSSLARVLVSSNNFFYLLQS